jgi:hypothetical protein
LLGIKYQLQARWVLIEIGLIVLTILVVVNFILGCGLFAEAVDNRRRNNQEEEEEALRLQHQQRPRRGAAGIVRSESFWIPNPQDIPRPVTLPRVVTIRERRLEEPRLPVIFELASLGLSEEDEPPHYEEIGEGGGEVYSDPL